VTAIERGERGAIVRAGAGHERGVVEGQGQIRERHASHDHEWLRGGVIGSNFFAEPIRAVAGLVMGAMPHLSWQLFAVAAAFTILVRHLLTRAETLSDRRFAALSAAAGALAAVGIGATFGTVLTTKVLGAPAGAIGDVRVSWIKAALALGAAALSMHEATLLGRGVRIRPGWRQGIAFALAAMAVAAYFRFGDIGHARFYHQHELFHYYLGSKYSRELGYEGLYRCVAVAQSELGQKNEVLVRKMMDLRTDVMVPARTALEHPEACLDRFTPERWAAFKTDVGLIRGSVRLQYWNGMQTDHGYNPPPVWTVMGHFWSSLHSATEGYLELLSLFDLALFAAMFAAIAWAFGWRVLAVAAIFWGCQLPGESLWTMGAFLRQDWLLLLVLSACLVRKRWYALGGAALAYSALLRVFPGVLAAGWAVMAAAHVVRHRRLAASHLRLLWGGALATVALVSISVAVAGADAYGGFYRHILVHKNTPLTNNMGLETVLSQSYEGRSAFTRDEKKVDPFEEWETLRRVRLHAFRPFQAVLLVALGLALVVVLRRHRSLYVALALSLAVVVAVVELICYYYSMFILSALLSRHRRGVEQWVLCVAGVSQLLAVNRILSFDYDDRYTVQSLLFCLFSVSLLFAYWPKRKSAVTRLASSPTRP
jgi:hypothetical protein